jgi:hypothetical protein
VPELTPHERRYLVKLRIPEALRETGVLLCTFASMQLAKMVGELAVGERE